MICMVLVVAALAVIVGAAVGFLLAGRRSVDSGLAAVLAVQSAVSELDRRSAQLTNETVQAALAQVLDVNRSQLEQATSANQAALAAQQELGAQRLESTAQASHALMTAQSQATKEELAAKEQLIEARLGQVQADVKGELNRLTEMLGALKEQSQESFGRVSSTLAFHASTTKELMSTTQSLREALASTKTRGQWGERMAEDVLHMAGFVENVNYVKQTSLSEGNGIPDYTFTMPKGHKLFMDVKFPLNAYMRYLESESDTDRNVARKQFLADVRLRVKELARRDYAAGVDAINNVLLFIPNETISSFIHENEPALFEDAMRQRIVFCSPLTLFAMLGVIRQAYDNFMVEEQASQILELVGRFKLQWSKYSDQVDKVDRSFQTVQKAFLELTTTRRNQLERVVSQIDGVREERGIDIGPAPVSIERVGLFELEAG